MTQLGLPLCRCGCGEPVEYATRSDRRVGWVNGEPKKFINGHQHQKQGPRYTIQDTGYETPCWVWDHAGGVGYGTMRLDGRTVNAHRIFYERTHGPVPAGLELDHLCRVRRCVNPDHLEPVTRAENTRRGNRHRSAA